MIVSKETGVGGRRGGVKKRVERSPKGGHRHEKVGAYVSGTRGKKIVE